MCGNCDNERRSKEKSKEKDEAFMPERPLPTMGTWSEYSFMRLFIEAVIVVESSLCIASSGSVLVVERCVSLWN